MIEGDDIEVEVLYLQDEIKELKEQRDALADALLEIRETFTSKHCHETDQIWEVADTALKKAGRDE